MVVGFRKINEQTHHAPDDKQQPIKGLREGCFGIYQRFICPELFECSGNATEYSDNGSQRDQRICGNIAFNNGYDNFRCYLLNNRTAPHSGWYGKIIL